MEIAREIWLLSEGAISLILVHGDRGYAAAAARAAHALIDHRGMFYGRPRTRADDLAAGLANRSPNCNPSRHVPLGVIRVGFVMSAVCPIYSQHRTP